MADPSMSRVRAGGWNIGGECSAPADADHARASSARHGNLTVMIVNACTVCCMTGTVKGLRPSDAMSGFGEVAS
jgi:hypothetical protein